MTTTLLAGGQVIDGSGSPAFPADVLLLDDRIAAIGRIDAPPNARRIDCGGLVVVPGFIDAHSHSDLQVLEDRPEKLRQGVTSEVVGNCGFSAYPAAQDRGALHEFANGIFCGDGHWGFASARDYLDAAARTRTHVASLVGHGTLRVAQAGFRHGPLDARDVDVMEQVLAGALSAGACGFSTGLMYAPGESAPAWELERLMRVVARHGRICATHMRNYSARLVEAVEEQIALADRTGCRIQISHFQAAGRKTWHLQQPALERIEQARARGVDIAFDCYPYICASTVLTQILPQWSLEGGIRGLLARLTSDGKRRDIAAEVEDNRQHEWTDFLISAGPADCVGASIADIANRRGLDPIDAVFVLLTECEGAVNILEYNQSDDNLRQTLCHPLSLVISDGFYVKGRPHPRLHGTFPLLLGKFCRDLRWLTLPEAIRKTTSAPAERFGLRGRGRLQPGYLADITVLDPDRIASPATYENPELPPEGIAHVFARGVPQNLNFSAN